VSTEEARVPPAATPNDPGAATPSSPSTTGAGTGAIAGASQPVVVPPGASHLELRSSREILDVVGTAFAKRDRGSKGGITIMVFRPNTSPAPTCENLSFIGGALKTGGFVSIGVTGFGGAPGRFDVVSFGYVDTAKGGGGGKVGGSGGLFDPQPTGTTIENRSASAKKLEGTVVAQTGGTTDRASGTIVAKICPDR
jgi:hypothetical protein